MSKRFRLFWAIFLLALCLVLAFGLHARHTAQGQWQRYSATYWDVFDTVTEIRGYAASEEEFQRQAEAVHQDLQRLHALYDIYNHYDGITNLYDLNAAAAAGPVAVEEDIFTLLQLAQQIYALTDGKANIAAGQLYSLWHAAREAATEAPENAALPAQQALSAAAQHCDFSALVLDEGAQTVYFSDALLQLDVGSIGKGYAVELAAQAAEARGVTSMLLSVGGNLRAIGQKPEGLWTGGLENPWAQLGIANSYGATVAILPLQAGQCLVTSGNYQRYFTVDGTRYCHLIDPDTLYPATDFSAVSVLANNSGLADGLSTGLFCMSLADGQALVESLEGVEACWMTPEGEVIYSPGFEAALAPQ